MKRSRRVMGVVHEELHRQAEYLRALEAKNVKVTRELSYLRERKQSIELDELKEKVIRLEAGIEAGQLEREAWASKTLDTSSNNTPSSVTISVTQALTDLRITHATPSSSKSKNTQHQKLIQVLEAEVRAAKEELRRKDTGFKAEEAYDDNATPAVDSVKVANMEEPEALLAEYENVNDQLTNDLGALEGLMVSTEELERVEQEKKALRQTISKHEQEITAQAGKIDELEQALFDLSGEIAAGRRVPPRTRVLCMPENPDQAWVDLGQTTMDMLKGDNEALVKRLKELEESRVSSNTASRIWRRAEVAGYAYPCETEHNPLALVMGIVKPSFGDARSDGVYTGQRGALAAFQCVTKSSSTTRSLLGHASTALNLYAIEFEVDREVFFGVCRRGPCI
ncbi:hypothetical protein BKA70DRAFT_1439240 [Coprinopsis sp. MPI-PUGE-AT-0042]|nr:hypothetical protein BKA70DRAFT_1439240 [Coprinopsis sp. MPI-PUGE-AT-0042]